MLGILSFSGRKFYYEKIIAIFLWNACVSGGGGGGGVERLSGGGKATL